MKSRNRLLWAMTFLVCMGPTFAWSWQGPVSSKRGGGFIEAMGTLDLDDTQRVKVRALLQEFRVEGGMAGEGGVARAKTLRKEIDSLLTVDQRDQLARALTGTDRAASAETEPPLVAVGTPEEQDRYRRAADYSAAKAGLSILVMKDGVVVFEQYHDGHTRSTPHQLASATKSFWGVAAAAAADDGLLTLDELASDTIGEWKGDPRRSRITIRHLLSFTSGLAPSNRLFQRADVKDRYTFAVRSEAAHDPGTTYQYDDVHLYAFGEVLRRKLLARPGATAAEDPLDYLRRRVLDPIGLSIGRWARDQAGNPALPYGAVLTAPEWAKFGELLRNGGVWKGKTIVTRRHLDECFVGSDANPAYGLTFWLNAPPREGAAGVEAADGGGRTRTVDLKGHVARITHEGIYRSDTLRDLVMAAGAGQQRLYIIPSRGLVVVRQANKDFGRALLGEVVPVDRSFRDAEFLGILLDGAGE